MKSVPITILPALDIEVPDKLETATLAMGCFWSPEALYGARQGVVRTRVGYAGGTTEAPSYRRLGDHIETLQFDFDPSVISYGQLLDIFFDNHKPVHEPWKRQYASALFYHSREQERLITEKIKELETLMGKKIFTELVAYQEFYLAEDRHQKYKLQRQPVLMAEFQKLYPQMKDFINSTAATRVNGYLGVPVNPENLLLALGSFGLSEKGQQILLERAGGR